MRSVVMQMPKAKTIRDIPGVLVYDIKGAIYRERQINGHNSIINTVMKFSYNGFTDTLFLEEDENKPHNFTLYSITPCYFTWQGAGVKNANTKHKIVSFKEEELWTLNQLI